MDWKKTAFKVAKQLGALALGGIIAGVADPAFAVNLSVNHPVVLVLVPLVQAAAAAWIDHRKHGQKEPEAK